MSELSSLYCKVKITKSQLEEFLNCPVEKPELNKNWLEWWESRKMYSKMELNTELLRAYNFSTNNDVVDYWMEYKQAMTFSDYDQNTEIWHWGMLFFSENFTEMLPMLNFIISLEKFVIENTENMAIVYPYFWGDNTVDAYIHFDKSKGILSPKIETIEDVNPEIMKETIFYLNKKWEEFSKEMNFD